MRIRAAVLEVVERPILGSIYGSSRPERDFRLMLDLYPAAAARLVAERDSLTNPFYGGA